MRDVLRVRARARLHTLPVPPGTRAPNGHAVEPIPNTGVGHLPPHDAGGVPLLRVYLAVDYDYTENRVGALAAHVAREPLAELDYAVGTLGMKVVIEDRDGKGTLQIRYSDLDQLDDVIRRLEAGG